MVYMGYYYFGEKYPMAGEREFEPQIIFNIIEYTY